MAKKLAIVVLGTILAAGVYSKPVLEVSPENFDFGITTNNSILVHKAWIKSTGTDTVRIDRVATGCVCTSMPLEKEILAPGDSVQVEVRWDTKKARGISKQYPRVYYENDDPELRLALTANVVAVPDSTLSVTAWPFRFELGKHPVRSIDSLEFRLKNTTNKDIEVWIASHEINQCVINLPKVLPANSNVFGYIKIKPDHLNEEFEDSVTLRFSHDVKHVLTIPIRRKIYSENQ